MPGENVQDWSTTALTNGTADSSINFAEGQTRKSLNNSARSVMAAIAKKRNLENGSIATGGSANAQTFTSGVGYTSVPQNLVVRLALGFTNTASATLNMDGIGAVTIKDMLGNSLGPGALIAGAFATFIYNGTNWILLSPTRTFSALANGSVGVGTPVALTTGVAATVTAVSLTPGEWDVRGVLAFTATGGTPAINYMAASVSTTTNSMAAADSEGSNYQFVGGVTVFSVLSSPNLPVGPVKVSLSANTTVYLVGLIGYTGSGATVAGYGSISGRPVY